jgi:hypothetical protein
MNKRAMFSSKGNGSDGRRRPQCNSNSSKNCSAETEEEKNKAEDERERKGNSSKKVKTNFTHSPGVKFVFTLPPNAVEKDRKFR